MKSFDEVVAFMQVGSRRTEPPSVDVLPLQPDWTPEKRALILGGTLDLMRRAGAQPLTGVDSIPASPTEVRPVAYRSLSPLREAFNAKQTAAILEWGAKAAAVGKMAPPGILSELVPLAAKHPSVLGPVLGVRGHWLAELWGVRVEPEVSEWEKQRCGDPSGYREWLAKEIEEMDWKDRAGAIAVLRQGLSSADEGLLEGALQDRRKEVREVAAELLLSMDESRASAELSRLVSSMIGVEKGILRTKIGVTPIDPDTVPKWLPQTNSRPNFGKKALAVFDIFRFLPPRRLEFGLAPGQFLGAVSGSDYARAVVEGCQEAAVRYGDQVWMDALFEFLFSRDPSAFWTWNELVRNASDEMFNKTVIPKISGLGSGARTAVDCISLRQRPFSSESSKRIILALRTRQIEHLILEGLVNFLDPSSIDLVASPYSQEGPYEQTRQKLYRVLDIRNRLLASLTD